MGLIGLVFAIVALIFTISSIVMLRKLIFQSEGLYLATLIFVAFLAVSLVGVVLEAPFGAIAFWWSCGLICAEASKLRLQRLRRAASHVEEGMGINLAKKTI